MTNPDPGDPKMGEVVADTVKEGSRAIARLSNPVVYAPALSFILILIMSLMMWSFRIDWREERMANVKVLREMATAIRDLNDDFRAAGISRQTRHRKIEE